MGRAKRNGGEAAVDRLRAFGLRYPGAHTKSPWPGHLDLAVENKTFAYLSLPGEPPSISCKLPRSADAALALPFTTPTAYGLGKSGWVTATFPNDSAVPLELLEQWIDESYRAQAPKRLSAGLPAPGAALEAPVVVARTRAIKKRTSSSTMKSSASRRAEPTSTGKRAAAAAGLPKQRSAAGRVTKARVSKRAGKKRTSKR